MDVLVRSYASNDAADVVAFYRAASAADSAIAGVSLEAWLRFVGSESSRGGRDFLVAIAAGQVLGLATSSLRIETQRLRHLRIIVLPEQRRAGIGTSLLNRLCQLDVSLPLTTYQTLCPDDWLAGIRFFERFGFAEHERELQLEWTSPRGWRPAAAIAKLIRVPNPAECGEEVANLHNIGYAGDASFVRWTGAAMSALLSKSSALWIAKVHGDVAGYCHVEDDGASSWIESVVVHPSFRRRGIASALCRAVWEENAAAGRRIHLQVSSGNKGAMELYGKLGFQRTSESIRMRALQSEILVARAMQCQSE